ncbi:hypothetical protein M9H77_15773 [Catharanthus roseus]|uniref:Uncharacterized protein n=1 Tax=Catharanthus roseus TaxID=4058 RepID=A0ACC0AYI8_CATRO|nr:hypothetical protein M9H77_15773 [Catharanthus roseus]
MQHASHVEVWHQWRQQIIDGLVLPVEDLSSPRNDYIRWYRDITQVYIGNLARCDTQTIGYQPVGGRGHTNPRHGGEGGGGSGKRGRGDQEFDVPGDPFDSPDLDALSFSLYLTPFTQSHPSGSSKSYVSPPSTGGRSYAPLPLGTVGCSFEAPLHPGTAASSVPCATHPVRVVLFWDSEHARDAYCPYFTRAAKKTWTFTRMVTHNELVRKILKHRVMDPNLWQFRAYLDMGSGKQIHVLIESCTIRLLDWNDAMTDIQLGMSDSKYCAWYIRIKKKATHGRWEITRFTKEYTCLVQALKQAPNYDVKICFRTNITSYCQRSRDPCLEHHPRSASKTSDGFCGKWRESTLPCSHALAVCRDNGTRPDAYVSDTYSRETYRMTYQSNFYPVGHKGFWRDAPYNLTFYPTSMNNQRGRKQCTRFCGEIDYQNSDSLPKCSRC